MMEQRQPILQQTCATASTTAESRYRIDFNDFPRRDSRIIALDPAATVIVRNLATLPWEGGRFFFYGGDAGRADAGAADDVLTTLDGQSTPLDEQIDGADSVVMIATAEAAPAAAAIIGDRCAASGVMSAAIMIDDGGEIDEALQALRPNAMVLVLIRDERDIPDMLTALRA
jgi:hypothetical protein